MQSKKLIVSILVRKALVFNPLISDQNEQIEHLHDIDIVASTWIGMLLCQ